MDGPEQVHSPAVSLDQLQPGDLVTDDPVSHVVIYVGNGMVVGAVDESSGILYRPGPVRRAVPDATGHRIPCG